MSSVDFFKAVWHQLIDIADNLKLSAELEGVKPSQKAVLTLLGRINQQITSKDVQTTSSPQYLEIESLLQKQEGHNRALIKKDLEYQEYQKVLTEELSELKIQNKHLKAVLNKLTQNGRQATLTPNLATPDPKNKLRKELPKRVPPSFTSVTIKKSSNDQLSRSAEAHHKGKSESSSNRKRPDSTRGNTVGMRVVSAKK